MHVKPILVSIPAWCDWEIAQLPFLFPFSHGFNSSLVRLGADFFFTGVTRPVFVSIPAWCDWETALISKCFGLSTVSIPAWCDWEHDEETRKRIVDWVSIPAWCDWEW